MAKKMYYTEEETAKKLGVSTADLAKFVRDDKLRVFQDGHRKMYKVEEVDALTSALTPAQDEVVLTPADSIGDQVKIDEESPAATKEDTVITAEGISIFDDEDLEIGESADPMAKTQIAPTLEEKAAGDGVGSGSGLLDLTRESDDTSLGAEVLDHIGGEMEASVGSGLSPEEPAPGAGAETAPALAAAVIMEMPDPASGLFSGLIVGSAIMALVVAMVSLGLLGANLPDYIEGMKQNIVAVVIVLLVVAGVLGAGGYFLTQSAATRAAALKKMSG